ncbi:hypothetical protein NADFUDRAFT_53116 [Nadsonia fulvescens var. elongata DSM 6958]|uniref:VASt domain-containing protein n=1 Tax=Nadsonia fulvescens var. elongata DSM 6958 TaxID=857566 RepID=A0A1E3PDF9_9ASCO|nr:hypothetical protein NADFUDRAFT_53116 [Nadsonia fulvescens var. elongata DSM 6958]
MGSGEHTPASSSNDVSRSHSHSSNMVGNSPENDSSNDGRGSLLSNINTNDSSHSGSSRFAKHFSIFSKLSNRSRSNSEGTKASRSHKRSQENSHLSSAIANESQPVPREGVNSNDTHGQSKRNSTDNSTDPTKHPEQTLALSRSTSSSTLTDRKSQDSSLSLPSHGYSNPQTVDSSGSEGHLSPIHTNASMTTSNSIGSEYPASLIPSIGSTNTTNMAARKRRDTAKSDDLESQLDNRFGNETYAIRHSEDLSTVGHNMLSSVVSAAQAAANTLSDLANSNINNNNSVTDQSENKGSTHSRRWQSLDLRPSTRKEPGKLSSGLPHFVNSSIRDDLDNQKNSEASGSKGEGSHDFEQKNTTDSHNNHKDTDGDKNYTNGEVSDSSDESVSPDQHSITASPKNQRSDSSKRKSRLSKTSQNVEATKSKKAKKLKEGSKYDKSGLLVKGIKERHRKRREIVKQKISDGIHRKKDKKDKAAVDLHEKQESEFHRLFKKISNDEKLLKLFPCAYNKEILLQGKMYVSSQHICFYAHVFGWSTTNVLPFEEIISIEAKNTAGLFPNGIVVQTTTDRYTYASFSSRDDVLKFLINLWKKGPSNEEKRYRSTTTTSDSEISDSDYNSSSSIYDEDVDSDSEYSEDESIKTDPKSSDLSKQRQDKADDSSNDESGDDSGNYDKQKPRNNNASSSSPVVPKSSGSGSYPIPLQGQEKHKSVSIDYNPESNDEKPLSSEIYSAPLGIVFGILFGEDTTLYKRFLGDKEHNQDVPDIPEFSVKGKQKTREFEYIKPLSGPIGPKQTKCICTEVIDHFDLDESITVLTTTQTPDVPSGSSFTVQTRYIFHWTDNNATKLILSYKVDWTGKSWIKGAIEKGSHEGQVKFAQNLTEYLNDTLNKSGSAKDVHNGSDKSKKKIKRNNSVRKRGSDLASAEKTSGTSVSTNTSHVVKVIDMISRVSEYRIFNVLPVWPLLVIFIAYFLFSIMFTGSNFKPASKVPGVFLFDNLNFALFSPYLSHSGSTRDKSAASTSHLFSNEVNWDNAIFDWVDDRVSEEMILNEKTSEIVDPLKVFIDLRQNDFKKSPVNDRVLNEISVEELMRSMGRKDLMEAIEINQAKVKILKEHI